jgi:pimeloyl-ACP methyl ester carboxylesterase
MKSALRILATFSHTQHHIGAGSQTKDNVMAPQVFYRSVGVDGLSIFYREAGPKYAPNILLLHGPPSSSRMFQPLLTGLADNYHLVAPDYPGFGHSDWPARIGSITPTHFHRVENRSSRADGGRDVLASH